MNARTDRMRERVNVCVIALTLQCKLQILENEFVGEGEEREEVGKKRTRVEK